jgi:hypothetical protein
MGTRLHGKTDLAPSAGGPDLYLESSENMVSNCRKNRESIIGGVR